MNHTGSEIYYLREEELKLLLAGLGQQEWYGLFSEETPQPAAEEPSEAELFPAGPVEAELLSAERSEGELLSAGLAERELLSAGPSEVELFPANRSEVELLPTGLAESDMLSAGPAEAELLSAERSEGEILPTGLAESDMLSAGPAEAELLSAERSEVELLSGLAEADMLFTDPVSAANRVLADMYQKGIIDWKEQCAVLREPYTGMFRTMLEKKCCVTVCSTGSSTPARCCYLSEKSVVTVQKSQREAATVGMSELSMDEWLAQAEEELDRLEEGEYLELVCRNSENGQVDQTIRMCREGIRTKYIEWDNGKRGSVRCLRGELRGRLQELLP